MLRSLVQKTILAAYICSSTINVHTAEKTTASTGTSLLASTATVAGVGCLAAGIVKTAGIFFKPEILDKLPPSVAELILKDPQYAFLIVPGAILTVGGTCYLAASAKGIFRKIQSLLGSAITTAGSAILATGTIAAILLLAQQKNIQIIEPFNNGSISLEALKSAVLSFGSAYNDLTWYINDSKLVRLPTNDELTQGIAIYSGVAASGGVIATLGAFLQP